MIFLWFFIVKSFKVLFYSYDFLITWSYIMGYVGVLGVGKVF